MARLKDIDDETLAKLIAKPPKLSSRARKRIDAVTSDESKRESMYAQAAVLEEVLEMLRPQVLKGVEAAINGTLKATRQLGELLRHKDADKAAGVVGNGTDKTDVPQWIPAEPPPAKGAPQHLDDAELNAKLAAATSAPKTPRPPSSPAPPK